jgi:hypothetical protein
MLVVPVDRSIFDQLMPPTGVTGSLPSLFG